MQDSLNRGPQPWPNPAYAWYVVAVLTIAFTVSFIDRQILSLLVGPIRSDLHISDTRFSLLQGLAFALFYTAMGLPIGRLADQKSRRGIIAAGIAVWSLMTAACGLAYSFWTLFLARMGVGVGQAALSPPAFSIVSDYFPPEKLPKAFSVYGMGIYLGAGLAFILGGAAVSLVPQAGIWELPLIGTLRPWQMILIVVGLPGLAVVLLMATVREPARRGRITAQDGVVPLGDVIDFVWSHKGTFGPLFFGISLLVLLGYAAGAWVPEFGIRTYGMARSEIAYLYGSLILILATTGMVAGGILTSRLIRKGYTDGGLRVIIGVALVTMVCGTLAHLMPTAKGFAIVMAPAIFTTGMPFGIAPAAIQSITPNEMRAQVSALYIFVINIIGMALGPTIVALITDYVFQDDGALRYSLAWVHALAAPAAALILWRGLKYYRASYREADAWRSVS